MTFNANFADWQAAKVRVRSPEKRFLKRRCPAPDAIEKVGRYALDGLAPVTSYTMIPAESKVCVS